jgi:ABC-type phosphate transport system substrate-binding protein
MNGKILWKSLPIVALALASGRAHAQDCMLGANAIVLSGSSAMGPTVKATAGPLLAQGNVDVFYYAPGSCTGTNAFLNGDDLGGKSADHYDAMGNKSTCTLPAGTKADLGVSDVFVEVCTGGTKPAGVTDNPGFIQSMLYVVPKPLSTQTALVAEEGYFVFGAGTTGFMGMTISPWVDQTKFAIRNAGSGTQQMIARSINLTAEAMKGTDSGGTGGVVTALTMAGATQATAEPAIGIISSDAYDVNRMTLKALAFQAFKQKHAYFPDSTASGFDKKNVRDGHYTIWGPLHMVTKTGAKQQVQDFIDYVSLKKPLGTTKFIDVIIGAHVVPSCAMKVQRSTEMGPLSPYTPPAGTACGCYFDEKIKGAGMSGCTACPMGNECTGGKTCSNGFCE